MKNEIELAGIEMDSIVDGPGLRMTLFVQGCPHRCNGCHNPQTWLYGMGEMYSINKIKEDMLGLRKYYQGITISGGEPLSECHLDALTQITDYAKELGWDIWLYTGYKWDDIPIQFFDLISKCLVLIDGQFQEDKKSYECRWRGSTNQRLIDVQASLTQGEVITLE